MKQSTVIIYLVLLILSNNLVISKRRTSSSSGIIKQNDIDRPLVEALSPRGLRVSISHVDGMEFFAFHGKVNSPIRGSENGNLDKDILFPTNGRWVFEDHEVQLRIGDVINYWIFVQINGMGHRLDNLSTIIRELVPIRRTEDRSSPPVTGRPLSYSPTYTPTSNCVRNDCHTTNPRTTIPRDSCACNCNTEQYATISTQLNVTLTQLQVLHDKMVPLHAQVESLTESFQELIKDMNIGTQLLLTGQEPPGTNPLEAVRELITEKLGLLDLDQNIRQAYQTSEGILFEMSSSIDKKRILFRANKRLRNSGYKIEDPQDNYSQEIPRRRNQPTRQDTYQNQEQPLNSIRTTSSPQRPRIDMRSTLASLIQDPNYNQGTNVPTSSRSTQYYDVSRIQEKPNRSNQFIRRGTAEIQDKPFSNTRTIISSQEEKSPIITDTGSTVVTVIQDPYYNQRTQNRNDDPLSQHHDNFGEQEIQIQRNPKIQPSTRGGNSRIQTTQSKNNRRVSSERRLNTSQNSQIGSSRGIQLSTPDILSVRTVYV